MKNQISNRKSKIIPLIAACLTLAAFGPPAAERVCGQQGRGVPPFPVNNTFTVSGICDFDVQVTITGRQGLLFLPSGGIIFTSPNYFTTFTNLSDPTKSVTLNTTGVVHVSFDENGNTIYVNTGRTAWISPHIGMVLLVGNFTVVYDSNGNFVSGPTGNGQIKDICGLIN